MSIWSAASSNARCREIGSKVHLIVNYDGFDLDPVVSDAYFSTIAYLESRYYETASRYTTSAFMRLKLGASLQSAISRPTCSRHGPRRRPAVALAEDRPSGEPPIPCRRRSR